MCRAFRALISAAKEVSSMLGIVRQSIRRLSLSLIIWRTENTVPSQPLPKKATGMLCKTQAVLI